MINTNKVRGRIVEKGLTQDNVAKSIGIAQTKLPDKGRKGMQERHTLKNGANSLQ